MPSRPTLSRARTVVVLAFEGVEALDVTGPLSVFSKAERMIPGSYRSIVASPVGGTVTTASSLAFADTRSLRSLRGPIDTLLVAGGDEAALLAAHAGNRLVPWLRRVAPGTRRVGSVCTGAFALAAAGLLDGHRATTHWASCDRLAAMYPRVRVEPDAIFTVDGARFTSAGVTAGIDLALALVEDDLGRDLASTIARELVVYLRRPGGQKQFSTALSVQTAATDRFEQVVDRILRHPDAELGVPALASRAAMSERNFSRRFTRELGVTPARFVESVRVERARQLLESTNRPIERVAEDCGFGSIDGLQRAMKRALGTTPSDHRRRFARR